jgi:hypothetical protein
LVEMCKAIEHASHRAVSSNEFTVKSSHRIVRVATDNERSGVRCRMHSISGKSDAGKHRPNRAVGLSSGGCGRTAPPSGR